MCSLRSVLLNLNQWILIRKRKLLRKLYKERLVQLWLHSEQCLKNHLLLNQNSPKKKQLRRRERKMKTSQNELLKRRKLKQKQTFNKSSQITKNCWVRTTALIMSQKKNFQCLLMTQFQVKMIRMI